jgi:hypothetical protein
MKMLSLKLAMAKRHREKGKVIQNDLKTLMFSVMYHPQRECLCL